MSDFLKRYLTPGLAFVAAVIGGGYATGRELVEFFLPSGLAGGLLGMVVTTLVWSLVLAVSFELARRARAFDYRSFFKLLLGPGWVLYEIAYVLLIIVIIAVMDAAAGEVVHDLLGVPKLVGSLLMIASTACILVLRSAWVERFLSLSVASLYLVFAVLIVWSLVAFGDRIGAAFAEPVGSGWFFAGVRYAGYNVAIIPAVLFCARHFTRPREAIGSGLLAGPLCMLPGAVFYVAMMGFPDAIRHAALPSSFLLEQLGARWFTWAFQIAVLSTLIDTGVALLHGINERVATVYEERRRPMPRALRPAIAVGIMVLSVYVADAVGLVGLIAKGYGLLTYAFIALVVVPVLTVGIFKIRGLPPQAPPPLSS
jgi:uncharacterized membrane protein YkvI